MDLDTLQNRPPSDQAQQILSEGIKAKTFDRIAVSDDTSFHDIFGPHTLLIVEFSVILIGEHSHLVYIPDYGRPSEIITSYPDRGELRVSPPVPWIGSRHSPSAKGGTHRVGLMARPFSPMDWAEMSREAQAIDDARLNYHFLKQNSNSVVATLLASAGLRFRDLPGGGINAGAQNQLHDELSGGRQARRLLYREGASYLGLGPTTDKT